MIIKNKPFHIPACQGIVCWYYAYPAVRAAAYPSPMICDADYIRRWPGFCRLESYQVRLSRFLVLRRADWLFDQDIYFNAGSTYLGAVWEGGRAGGVW